MYLNTRRIFFLNYLKQFSVTACLSYDVSLDAIVAAARQYSILECSYFENELSRKTKINNLRTSALFRVNEESIDSSRLTTKGGLCLSSSPECREYERFETSYKGKTTIGITKCRF